MTYEIISIAALLLCLLIIGVEYIFHYRLAEQQDDNAVLETVYADYLQALEQDHISCKNPELMLFTILELVSATGYNCIIYETPSDLQTYLPYLHDSIHQIILGFSQ